MFHINRRNLIWTLVLVALPMLTGCGTTRISEVYYYAVPSSESGIDNINYYRLTVEGHSILGVTQYRSGYFPSRAVDAFLGNVQLDKGARELEFEDKLMTIIDQATLKTWENYVNEVANDTTSQGVTKKERQKKIDHLQQARHQILEYPQKNNLEIDYNPAGNLVTAHSNDKLVFFLSSNPDEVMSKIASFAEDEKTIQSINRLSLFISDPNSKDAQVAEVQYKIQKIQLNTLAVRMEELQSKIDNNNIKRFEADQAVNELLALLNSISIEVKP